MSRHFLLRLAAFSATLMGGIAISCPAFGESASRVVSVEEHWELQVSQPDDERSAPQITMVMSPKANVDGTHFLFTLNHAAVPDYAPGGLQVQHWDGTELHDSHTAHSDTTLDREGETVHWVQRLTLNEGTLTFAVVDGHSESWGDFGGEELTLSTSTSLSNLNNYRPAVSLSESQVGYAENRVVSLVLTKLVWTTADGQVHEQNAPIPIDTSLDE